MADVLAPDGEVYVIPDNQLSSALAAGGRTATRVFAPDKTLRWVPDDLLSDAQKAGGLVVPKLRQPVKVMYDQERQNAEAIKRGGIGYDTSGMESANLDLGETAKYAAGSALAVGAVGVGAAPELAAGTGKVAAALRAAATSPLGKTVLSRVAEGAGIGAAAKYFHLFEPRK